MTEAQLSMLIRHHNAMQWIAAIGSAVAAAVLWLIAYWAFRLLFAFGANPWLANTWEKSIYVAIACLLLLAVEGFRRSWPLFDLHSYYTSEFYHPAFFASRTGYALNVNYSQPLAQGWIISQILFSAPQNDGIVLAAIPDADSR